MVSLVVDGNACNFYDAALGRPTLVQRGRNTTPTTPSRATSTSPRARASRAFLQLCEYVEILEAIPREITRRRNFGTEACYAHGGSAEITSLPAIINFRRWPGAATLLSRLRREKLKTLVGAVHKRASRSAECRLRVKRCFTNIIRSRLRSTPYT